MSSLISVEALSKTYQDGTYQTEVLKGVSFEVKPAQSIAILGESGSGKSTLLHIMGTLDTATNGSVLFEGQAVDQLSEQEKALLRNQKMGFIYQFHHLLSEFNAEENVAMPAFISGMQRAQALKHARALLDKVGLSHRAQHRPGELSGGERQRVAIARALMNQPKVVLADEPTGNLDAQNGKVVYDLMCALTRDMGMSFVVVTHDQQLASRLDRQLIMRDGELVEG